MSRVKGKNQVQMEEQYAFCIELFDLVEQTLHLYAQREYKNPILSILSLYFGSLQTCVDAFDVKYAKYQKSFRRKKDTNETDIEELIEYQHTIWWRHSALKERHAQIQNQ